jgi:hypothetical protein
LRSAAPPATVVPLIFSARITSHPAVYIIDFVAL